MSLMRRKGFTLIELLVVIAIIGILAAMLFPVFARARESARKTQCLSNVKNVAMALQMYLTDYDRFPPGLHQQDAIDFFGSDCPQPVWMADPYLRWQVILDEYTKNRDVYRCPSARNAYFPQFIMPGLGNWIDTYRTLGGGWNYCMCEGTWPSGWGGSVTDSGISGCPERAGQAAGAPQLDLMFLENVDRDKSMSQVNDAANYVVVVERGMSLNIWAPEQIAYPELCRSIWGQAVNNPDTCSRENQPDTIIPTSQINKFWTDASMRSPWARHMGGNNMGFADGHAKWMSADALLAAAGNWKNPVPTIEGLPECQCLPDAPAYQ